MQFRIGHLAFRTADMEKTLYFYTQMLSFKHQFSIKDDQGRPRIEYVMTPDGRFLEFFYMAPGEAPEKGTGYMHLCLEVDDCAEAVAQLEAKGVTIEKPVKTGKDGNRQAWIKDPDGRDIEIMQLVSDSPQYQGRASLKL